MGVSTLREGNVHRQPEADVHKTLCSGLIKPVTAPVERIPSEETHSPSNSQ
jgi:hypothetical protein